MWIFAWDAMRDSTLGEQSMFILLSLCQDFYHKLQNQYYDFFAKFFFIFLTTSRYCFIFISSKIAREESKEILLHKNGDFDSHSLLEMLNQEVESFEVKKSSTGH